MNTEQQKIEYKSLQKIRTGEKGFKELSTTCVALANAQGGQIMIGVEDKTKKPAPNQVIPQEEANSAITRLRGLCFNVGLAVGDVCADETGSQYFAITVFPSLHSYATTSDGKMYIRVADKCEPVRSEDIQRVGEEKGAFQWELVPTLFELEDENKTNLSKFANDIRQSDRVKQHIKQLDDIEIGEQYHLLDGNKMTNLGDYGLVQPNSVAAFAILSLCNISYITTWRTKPTNWNGVTTHVIRKNFWKTLWTRL